MMCHPRFHALFVSLSLTALVAGLAACDAFQEPADPTATPPAPVLNALTPEGPSTVVTPRLDGTSVEGATVIVYSTADCTGAQLAQVEVEAAGTFRIDLTIPLNAETRLSANARRASGPLSPCSGALTYVHDDIAPEAPLLLSCSPTSPSNVNDLNLHGSAEGDSDLIIFADDACAGAPVVETRTDTLLSVEGVPVSVPDDTVNLFYARVRDAAGNESACSADPFEFIEDSTAPSAPSLTAVSPNSPSSDPAPMVTGTADADARVSVHSDAGCSTAALLGEGSSADFGAAGIALTMPANAETPLFILATDEAGNGSDCVDSGVTYAHDDNAPDSPTLTGPTAGSATDIQLTGAAEPGSAVDLFDDGTCAGTAVDTTTADASSGDFSFDVTVGTTNGDNTYSVMSRDAAGQPSACSPALTYTHDDSTPDAPVITGFDPTSPSQTITDPAAVGTAEAGALVALFANADCSGTAMANDQVAGDGSFSVPLTLPPNSVSQVSAQQTDPAGNVSTCGAAVSWMHDDASPVLTLLGLTADSSIAATLAYSALTDNVSVVTEIGVEVCITTNAAGCDPFATTETATTTGDGNLALAETLLPDTRFYVWARPVDAAGNVGDIQGPVSGRTLASAGATSLAVGAAHTCAVKADGTVACFGDDASEQLGTPGAPAGMEAAAETVAGLSGVVAVGSGADHSCALLSIGDVYCWGDNAFGQTGNTGAGIDATPFLVDLGGAAAKQLVVGADHTCALIVDGTLRCWGRGTEGQLGDGNLTHSTTAVTPVGASGVRALAAGDDHTCAITAPGQVWCWGSDALGQLGNGAAASAGVAVQAEPGSVVAIGAGAAHSCAVMDDGTVRCWGDNSASQLGAGLGAATVDAPVDVQLMTSAVALAGGALHTCALQADGDAFCWGDNTNGQLGDGSTTLQAVRTLVTGGHTYSGISASSNATCAWAADGQAHCWGLNAGGNLGLGASSDGDYNEPQPLTIEAPTAARRVVAGVGVSGAITTAGELWLWGSGDSGLKGDAVNGDAAFAAVSVPVGAVSGIETVGFGSNHACALDTAGSVHCWGANDFGQIDGNAAAQLLAPADAGVSAAHALAVGKRHACVVTQDRTVECWGDNGDGQLGTGDTATVSGANTVAGVAGAVDVAAGDDFSCAVLADGTSTCWGTEDTGQLGLGGTAGTVMGPTPTPGVAGVVQIVAGADHACALTSGGDPLCWGSNQNGQLGHSAVNSIQSAAAVPAATSATALSSGSKHTCAARLGDQVRCWGWGELGQLGYGDSPTSEVTPQTVGLGNLWQVAAGADHTCYMQADQSIRCAGANLDEQLGNDAAGISSADPVVAPTVP